MNAGGWVDVSLIVLCLVLATGLISAIAKHNVLVNEHIRLVESHNKLVAAYDVMLDLLRNVGSRTESMEQFLATETDYMGAVPKDGPGPEDVN